MFKKIAIILFLITLSYSSYGKLFNTSYVSFEIPENWKCKSFGTDWVCHSSLSKQEKEAMIILTAKMAGNLDNLQTYENFLKQSRKGVTRSKQAFESKVIHSKRVFINNQAWVDGFHKESEIPSYYTRYVVTVCCNNNSAKLAILATYSAHVNHYTKYASDFLKSINSLRVLDIKKTISKMKSLGSGENLGSISSYMEDLLDEDSLDNDRNDKGSLLFGLTASQLGMVSLIVFALGFYAFIKTRKKPRRKRRK